MYTHIMVVYEVELQMSVSRQIMFVGWCSPLSGQAAQLKAHNGVVCGSMD